MSIFPQSGFRTTDDGVLVASYLLSSRENRVLGASSKDMEGSFGCPSDKPVVGWVNFQGRRVIPTNLPAGEEPSACFVDTAEAVAQGFAIEE